MIVEINVRSVFDEMLVDVTSSGRLFQMLGRAVGAVTEDNRHGVTV